MRTPHFYYGSRVGHLDFFDLVVFVFKFLVRLFVLTMSEESDNSNRPIANEEVRHPPAAEPLSAAVQEAITSAVQASFKALVEQGDAELPPSKVRRVDELLSSESDEDGEVSDDSDLLSVLPTMAEEGTGPNLDAAVADIVNAYIKTPLSGTDLNEELKVIKRPGNTEIAVPSINPELNSVITRFGRNRDRALFRAQSTAYKANVPLLKMMSDLHSNKKYVPSRKEVMRTLASSVSISMASMKLISQVRRHQLRPEVGIKYRPFLASTNIPVEKFLFGNDFQKFVKDCSAANTATNKLTKTKNGSWARKGRNRNYNNYSNRFTSSRASDYNKRRPTNQSTTKRTQYNQ